MCIVILIFIIKYYITTFYNNSRLYISNHMTDLLQWGIGRWQNREYQAHPAVSGSGVRTTLLDRAADSGGQSHHGRYPLFPLKSKTNQKSYNKAIWPYHL